jgi:hypothetical protein
MKIKRKNWVKPQIKIIKIRSGNNSNSDLGYTSSQPN